MGMILERHANRGALAQRAAVLVAATRVNLGRRRRYRLDARDAVHIRQALPRFTEVQHQWLRRVVLRILAGRQRVEALARPRHPDGRCARRHAIPVLAEILLDLDDRLKLTPYGFLVHAMASTEKPTDIRSRTP